MLPPAYTHTGRRQAYSAFVLHCQKTTADDYMHALNADQGRQVSALLVRCSGILCWDLGVFSKILPCDWSTTGDHCTADSGQLGFPALI
jgi:hypothetical protein